MAVSLAVLGVAGLGLASAARLSVNSSALGAGTDVVASCDDSGVKVDFQNSYDSASKGYVVSAVVLSQVDAKCVGQTVALDLLAGDPESATAAVATLGHASATVPAGGTVTVPVATAVAADQVNGVAVVIAS
ncbi:hypothetical protein AGMMS50218_18110 [Actinomycetota bacterium]|nr:hypothetical protein AGMMS50218_18110 [Actinomycetota bacterium]